MRVSQEQPTGCPKKQCFQSFRASNPPKVTHFRSTILAEVTQLCDDPSTVVIHWNAMRLRRLDIPGLLLYTPSILNTNIEQEAPNASSKVQWLGATRTAADFGPALSCNAFSVPEPAKRVGSKGAQRPELGTECYWMCQPGMGWACHILKNRENGYATKTIRHIAGPPLTLSVSGLHDFARTCRNCIFLTLLSVL